MKLPWKKTPPGHPRSGESEAVAERGETRGEIRQGSGPENAFVREERPVQANVEASEWVREYSQKIAEDAQRAIAELHQKIAESAERAMADFKARSPSPDQSEQGAVSTDEAPESHASGEDGEA